MEKNRGGRPTKLDDANKRRLLRRVMTGQTKSQAARGLGCSPRTVSRAVRHDADFQWRLRVAERVRDRLLRRNESRALRPNPRLAWAAKELHRLLRAHWGDKTATAAGPVPYAPKG